MCVVPWIARALWSSRSSVTSHKVMNHVYEVCNGIRFHSDAVLYSSLRRQDMSCRDLYDNQRRHVIKREAILSSFSIQLQSIVVFKILRMKCYCNLCVE